MPPRRVGRPSVAVLNRDLIAQAALTLLDESGADGFTMARLAGHLRVRPSALYNHVAGKEDVLAGVRELISDRIDVSGFGSLPWPEAVLRWAHSYRIAFAAHPPTIAILAVMPLTGAHRTIGMYEAVIVGLREAGWPEPEILPVVVALESFILGSALDLTAPADMFQLSDPGEAPAFASAYRARTETLGEQPPADIAFRTGLEAIVEGLETRFRAVVGG